jgi:hypothetical protein
MYVCIYMIGEGLIRPQHRDHLMLSAIYWSNKQNYWVFGLCLSSGIPNTRTHHFGNWIWVSSSGEAELTSTTWLFLRNPTQQVSPPTQPRTEKDQVSETLCSLVFRIPDDGWCPKTQQFWVVYIIVKPLYNLLHTTQFGKLLCVTPFSICLPFLYIKWWHEIWP